MILKTNFYKQLIELYIKKELPDYLLLNYFNNSHSFAFLELQDYISGNLKKEFNYLTGIGIIESVELLYKYSLENGNI